MPTLSGFVYDIENRLTQVTHSQNGTDKYRYDPANRRVWHKQPNNNEVTIFYGLDGERMGRYAWTSNWVTWSTSVYFAGKLIWDDAGGVVTDRLGSVVTGNRKYFPYGEEPTTTSQNRTKFATYFRDATTALDYAHQRFYARTTGRFLSPDPYLAPAGTSDPASWNRYTYVQGDPANFLDRRGLIRDLAGEFINQNCWVEFTRTERTTLTSLNCIPQLTTVDQALASDRRCDTMAKKTGLPGLNYRDAKFIMDVAKGNTDLASLIAFTWSAESSFRHSPPNNVNRGGTVDIGPMQINYQTWTDELNSSKYNPNNLSAQDVFGTTLGAGQFNGSYKANVTFGAEILRHLYNRYGLSAAGYYRTGEGAFLQTSVGREQFAARQTKWEKYKDSLLAYFRNEDCF
jgi:RHS repeat-associated protein